MIIRYYATFVLLVYNRSFVSMCCCVLWVKIKILFLSSETNWMTIPFFRDGGWCKSYFPQRTQCVNINAVATLLLCTGHCRTWKIPDGLNMSKSSGKGCGPSTATQEKDHVREDSDFENFVNAQNLYNWTLVFYYSIAVSPKDLRYYWNRSGPRSTEWTHGTDVSSVFIYLWVRPYKGRPYIHLMGGYLPTMYPSARHMGSAQ